MPLMLVLTMRVTIWSHRDLAEKGMEEMQDAKRACPPESPTFIGVTAKIT